MCICEVECTQVVAEINRYMQDMNIGLVQMLIGEHTSFLSSNFHVRGGLRSDHYCYSCWYLSRAAQ